MKAYSLLVIMVQTILIYNESVHTKGQNAIVHLLIEQGS